MDRAKPRQAINRRDGYLLETDGHGASARQDATSGKDQVSNTTPSLRCREHFPTLPPFSLPKMLQRNPIQQKTTH